MRTKTLLLTAALCAAGVATSMAQVYSVNAVGYVNTTLIPGFNLISNPLVASDNSVAALFKDLKVDGAQVYKFNSATSTFKTATYDEIDGAFGPADAASQTVVPGEGVFVRLPAGTAPITITFVGEVAQGANLDTPLPKGLAIVSSQVPQEGTAAELGLVGADGDQVFQFDEASQSYRTSTYDEIDGAWGPALAKLAVGEAFFFRNAGAAAKVWHRSFSVNP